MTGRIVQHHTQKVGSRRIALRTQVVDILKLRWVKAKQVASVRCSARYNRDSLQSTARPNKEGLERRDSIADDCPVGRGQLEFDGDCGTGRDVAYVDRVDRVSACERVVRP